MSDGFLVGAAEHGVLPCVLKILYRFVGISSLDEMHGQLGSDLPRAFAKRQGFAFANPPVHTNLLGFAHALREHGLVQRMVQTVAFTQRVIRPLLDSVCVNELPLTYQRLTLLVYLLDRCLQSSCYLRCRESHPHDAGNFQQLLGCDRQPFHLSSDHLPQSLWTTCCHASVISARAR